MIENPKDGLQPGATPGVIVLTIDECISLGIPKRSLMRWTSQYRIKTHLGEKMPNGKIRTLIDPISLHKQLLRSRSKRHHEIALELDKLIAKKLRELGLIESPENDRPEIETGDRGDRRVARVEEFERALWRFPTAKQKDAARARCLELEVLVEEYELLRLKRKVRAKGRPTPAMRSILMRAAAVDPVWLDMFPADAKEPSLSTFEKWVKRYRKRGKISFLRKPPALIPKKDGRFIQIPEAAEDWLGANLRNYTADKKILTVHLGRAFLIAGKREGWELPWTSWGSTDEKSCYSWLRRWLRRNVSSLEHFYITKGKKKLRQTVSPGKRSYEKLLPWNTFTTDFRQFDVIVNRDGRLIRLWLCPIIDLRSRALGGYAIQDIPNSRGVRLAILDMVRQSEWKKRLPGLADVLCGLPIGTEEEPALIQFDNGREFKNYSIDGEFKKHRVSFDKRTETFAEAYKIGIVQDLGMDVTYCLPASPRGKPAEWWFGYVARWEKSLVGYRGHKPEQKPHWLAAAFRAHNAKIQRKHPKGEDLKELPPKWLEYYEKTDSIFPLEEHFRADFVNFCIEYLSRKQASLKDGYGKLSPYQYLATHRDPNQVQLPTDWALAQMLMERREVTVDLGELRISWPRAGSFSYWEPDGGQKLNELPHKAKCEFLYEPELIGRGWIYFDGQFVAMVENGVLLDFRSSSEDIRELKKRQSSQLKWARDRVQARETRARPELIAVSLERADEQAEQVKAAMGASRPVPVSRITKYDQVPKGKRKRFEVVKRTEDWNDDDEFEVPAIRTVEDDWHEDWEVDDIAPISDPDDDWIELWEGD